MLFERHPSTSIHPKACGINQRTTEILRVMGVEEDVYAIAAPAEIAGRTAWYTSLGEEGKEVFSRDAWGGGQYAAEYAQHSPSRYCILPQIKLEPILKRRAVELNPHQIFYGHEVLTTEDHGDFAEVTVKNRSTGDVSRHRGTYVIVADGGRQFTTQLGVEWSGEGDLLTMISAHIRSPIRALHPDNRNFITWFTNPAMGGSTLTGYLYQLGPWPEAMTSPEIEEWMFVCAQAADDPTKFDAETALARARKTIGIPDLNMELISLSEWTVNALYASQWRVGRHFLVGDSAHRIPPWGALGMNSGIQDANNLVWKLSIALKNSSRHYDSLLDTYYEERSEVGKRVGQTSLNNMRSHSGQIDRVMGVSASQSQAENLAAGAAFFDKGHPEYAEKQRLIQLASQALDTEFKAPGMDATIEWFGATTFRVKANGLVIFLDTWLERPDVLPKVLAIDDVTEADYIFISHAHFDHLPGADKIAIKTGAHVVANGEAINVLRSAGVPEDQLIPVSGGERIPLFSLECRQAAARGEVDIAPGPPGAPAAPDAKLAAASVHVWPSLHCLMPGGSHADVPAIMDTGKEYIGGASQYACTLDITFGMKYGLLKIGDHIPRDAMDSGMRSFVDYVNGPARGCMSHFDGGQLMYNFLFGEGKTLLWNGHLGAYDGILKTVQPQPDVLIQAIAGRANLNGRPFDGSAAQFAVQVSKLLGEPKKVIWCLHDEAPIKPWTVDHLQPITSQSYVSDQLSLEPDLLWDALLTPAQFLFPFSPVPSLGPGTSTDFCFGDTALAAVGQSADDQSVQNSFGAKATPRVGVEAVDVFNVPDNLTAEEEDILIAEHIPHVPPMTAETRAYMIQAIKARLPQHEAQGLDANFPSLRHLDTYMQLYFEHFHQPDAHWSSSYEQWHLHPPPQPSSTICALIARVGLGDVVPASLDQPAKSTILLSAIVQQAAESDLLRAMGLGSVGSTASQPGLALGMGTMLSQKAFGALSQVGCSQVLRETDAGTNSNDFALLSRVLSICSFTPLRLLNSYSKWQTTDAGHSNARSELLDIIPQNVGRARHCLYYAAQVLQYFRTTRVATILDILSVLICVLYMVVYADIFEQQDPNSAGSGVSVGTSSTEIIRLDQVVDADLLNGWLEVRNHERPHITGVGLLHSGRSVPRLYKEASRIMASGSSVSRMAKEMSMILESQGKGYPPELVHRQGG
ncbi:hypothetical protein K4K54_008668 [Colletotrichum sp. SAR 10_86]|nr:hypothetical protein K4K54_008668 [Colletotrichum sp. SAR 10_86]